VFDGSLKKYTSRVAHPLNVGTATTQRELEAVVAPPVRFKEKHRLPLKEVIVADLSSLSQELGQKVDGLLGFDVLREYVTDFDCDANTVTIGKEVVGKHDLQLVPIYVNSNSPYIPVTIGDKNIYMLLDTGCLETLCLSEKHIKELASRGKIRIIGKEVISDLTGAHRQVSNGRVLARLGLDIPPEVMWSTGKESTVGMYFVSRYRLVLDGPNKKMLVKPSAKFSNKDHSDMDGMAFDANDPGLLVTSVADGSIASKCGILAGDRILEIAERDASKLPWSAIVKIFATGRSNELLLKVGRREEHVVIKLPK
jgi:hypothetical protein